MKKVKFQKTARHASKLNGSLRRRSLGSVSAYVSACTGITATGRWPSKIWELAPKNPGFTHAQIEPMNQPDTKTCGKIPFSDHCLANLCSELLNCLPTQGGWRGRLFRKLLSDSLMEDVKLDHSRDLKDLELECLEPEKGATVAWGTVSRGGKGLSVFCTLIAR
jgi:hypothetical protein